MDAIPANQPRGKKRVLNESNWRRNTVKRAKANGNYFFLQKVDV